MNYINMDELETDDENDLEELIFELTHEATDELMSDPD